MNTFKTILYKSDALFKEKGSKFIGYVFPVLTEIEINKALTKIIAEHPKATHHCYAYKYGIETPITRANDDGEPSNSAGKPILGQIESFDLTNILIVVVRYYGGTKLGVGGLQTAYKMGAKMAIEENEIVEKEIPYFFNIKFPFDKQGIVDHLLKNLSGVAIEKNFTSAVNYQVQIPKKNAPEFLERINIERSIILITEK